MSCFRRVLAGGALVAAILLAGPAPRAQEKDELPHPKTLEELQQAMRAVLSKHHVPGAGVALVQKGELLWCGGIGKADRASNRDVTCETEFRVGSISKTFVALALLKLQEEGRINLQSRLSDVAPEIAVQNRWDSSNPVRIVNLLEHTAGFDDMKPSEVYNLSEPYDYPLLEVFQRFPEPQTARWPPGTRFSYSNPGYGIAGYLIERVTLQAYDQYIRDNVLRPLGMEKADFRFTDANKPLLATGYKDNPPKPIGHPYIYLRPAGDLKASPGELAKLVQFFLRRGQAGDTQLLKPETIARMEVPETTLAARAGLRNGYGLGNYTEVEGGFVTHGHDGGIDGFISSYRYMPEQNWGYVALINSTVSGKAIQDVNRLAIDFLSQGLPKPQQPTITLAASELEKFTGYYAPRAPRNQMLAFIEDLLGGVRFVVENGKFYRATLLGKRSELLPVTNNSFRAEKEPEASLIFFTTANGRMGVSAAGIDGFAYGERISPLWPYLRLLLLGGSLVLMASSLLFALVWGLRWLFRRMKDVQHLSVRAVPLLATLSFALAVFSATQLGGTEIGTRNVWTLGIFLFTLLFPLLSVAGLVLAVRVPKEEMRRGVQIHSLLVSLACCCVSAFFAAWGLIGVRFWA